MNEVHIWIDADSCPTLVRNHAIKIAFKLGLKITLVANKNIFCQEKPYEMIILEQKKDAADDYIFENAKENDLVITRDIVFADRLVSKSITTINDRGTLFTKENIKPLLSNRNFDFQLAQIGLSSHYKEGYDKQKFSAFSNCFDKVIHKLIKLK